MRTQEEDRHLHTRREASGGPRPACSCISIFGLQDPGDRERLLWDRVKATFTDSHTGLEPQLLTQVPERRLAEPLCPARGP